MAWVGITTVSNQDMTKAQEAGAWALWDPVTLTSCGLHLTDLIPKHTMLPCVFTIFMDSQRISPCLCSAKFKPSLKALRLLLLLHITDLYDFAQ